MSGTKGGSGVGIHSESNFATWRSLPLPTQTRSPFLTEPLFQSSRPLVFLPRSLAGNGRRRSYRCDDCTSRGDNAEIREIRAQYREGAGSFWRDTTGAHKAGNPEDEDEEEGDHVGRRAPQRIKTWKKLLAAWRMMMSILGCGGTFFTVSEDPEKQGDPPNWPSITVSLGQGGDGGSAGQLGHIQ